MRYADVLLMYAETQNYLNNGPTQAAKDALKEVRERAGIGSMEIPTGQQELRTLLFRNVSGNLLVSLHYVAI